MSPYTQSRRGQRNVRTKPKDIMNLPEGVLWSPPVHKDFGQTRTSKIRILPGYNERGDYYWQQAVYWESRGLSATIDGAVVWDGQCPLPGWSSLREIDDIPEPLPGEDKLTREEYPELYRSWITSPRDDSEYPGLGYPDPSTWGRNDPLGEAAWAIKSSDDKMFKALRSKDRWYFNVVVLEDGSSDADPNKVRVLSTNWTIFKAIVVEVMNNPTQFAEFGDVTHPETGRAVMITTENRGEPIYTEYSVQISPRESSLPNMALADMDSLYDLPMCIRWPVDFSVWEQLREPYVRKVTGAVIDARVDEEGISDTDADDHRAPATAQASAPEDDSLPFDADDPVAPPPQADGAPPPDAAPGNTPLDRLRRRRR